MKLEDLVLGLGSHRCMIVGGAGEDQSVPTSEGFKNFPKPGNDRRSGSVKKACNGPE